MTGSKGAQRVRRAEGRRRDDGQREIRVWVPDTPASIAQIRAFAVVLLKGGILDALDHAYRVLAAIDADTVDSGLTPDEWSAVFDAAILHVKGHEK